MSIAIKVKNVSKSFNDSVILDDISIDFYENLNCIIKSDKYINKKDTYDILS